MSGVRALLKSPADWKIEYKLNRIGNLKIAHNEK